MSPGRPPNPADVQDLLHAIEDALGDFPGRHGVTNPAAHLPLAGR